MTKGGSRRIQESEPRKRRQADSRDRGNEGKKEDKKT